MSSAPGWREVLRGLRRPKIAVMLGLGFASGLPFLLVGNTLGFWMREEGIALTAIGFLSWVGLTYSLKFLWAPLIDKVDVPLIGRALGHRRGWMVAAQLGVIASLAAMALTGPGGDLTLFGAFALATAFASATQDIVIDAWRIEIADDAEELALLTAAHQLGYRAALLVTEALILIVAAAVGWPASYGLLAAAMGVGVGAALWAAEPSVRTAVAAGSLGGIWDAIVGPFVAFFRAHGRLALLMLAAISLYRLADFVIGPMINPFYADLGLAKETVGAVRGSVGLFASVAGVILGGLSAVRFGFVPTLLIGAVLSPGSNVMFAVMALSGPSLEVFSAAILVDNFATGFAGVALVTYMSSLTSAGYTATQYALLSSFYALLGKALKGLSGAAVDTLTVSTGLLPAYAAFFAGSALIGVPALLLVVLLTRRLPALPSPSASPQKT
ncbi:MAG: AmpG family muropeptide MFS transporter [Nevskiaceae bacterium]